jgi:hypothetical protein
MVQSVVLDVEGVAAEAGAVGEQDPVTCTWTTVQALARDLPETALHATSCRPTPRILSVSALRGCVAT